MMKTKVAVAILVAAGLAGSPLAANAKSHKSKHHSSMTSGANMKSDKSGNMGGANGSMAPSGTGSATNGNGATSSSGGASSGK
jgi:hypothetical protein